MNEPQFLYLTTTGRKSGSPHEIEIWFVSHNGRYYLVSEHHDRADWVRNLLQQPAVTFRVADQHFNGRARPIYPEQEPDLAAAVSTLMDAKYEWSNGLIVELSPTS